MADRIIRRQFRSGPRRQTEWIGSADSTGVQALGPSVAVLDQTFLPGLTQTIVRTRGLLYVQSDQVAGDEEFFGAMGAAVVSRPAAAAGVASLPTPITEEDSDFWFIHQFFAAGYDGTAGGGMKGRVFEFDSKAKRKINTDDAVVFLLENADATFGAQYILKFRMLLMDS